MKVHNQKIFLERRRELRRRETLQETILWDKLRNNKLDSHFKRQHSFGGYILDFYCFRKRLIIEIDGDSHDVAYDRVRDKYFSDLGYKTLRFRNNEIENHLDDVIKKITLSLRLGEGASPKRGG